MNKLFVCLFVALVSACTPITYEKPAVQSGQTNLYESNADRYLKNIVVKQKSEDRIVYEYKDVRIDELSNLAAKYCNQFGKRAVLEHTALFRNNRMRATFDCTVLQ